MRTKDKSVVLRINPILTDFLFCAQAKFSDRLGDTMNYEVVITSGCELTVRHSRTSLHYSGNAVDVRAWPTGWSGMEIGPAELHTAWKIYAKEYCLENDIPEDWIDVVLEKDHIHIEYQPKRA